MFNFLERKQELVLIRFKLSTHHQFIFQSMQNDHAKIADNLVHLQEIHSSDDTDQIVQHIIQVVLAEVNLQYSQKDSFFLQLRTIGSWANNQFSFQLDIKFYKKWGFISNGFESRLSQVWFAFKPFSAAHAAPQHRSSSLPAEQTLCGRVWLSPNHLQTWNQCIM